MSLYIHATTDLNDEEWSVLRSLLNNIEGLKEDGVYSNDSQMSVGDKTPTLLKKGSFELTVRGRVQTCHKEFLSVLGCIAHKYPEKVELRWMLSHSVVDNTLKDIARRIESVVPLNKDSRFFPAHR